MKLLRKKTLQMIEQNRGAGYRNLLIQESSFKNCVVFNITGPFVVSQNMLLQRQGRTSGYAECILLC